MATVAAAPAATEVKADYEALCKKLKEVSALGGISGLLGWDELTMMPPGSADARAAQKAALAGVLHEKQTDAELGELLRRLQAANLEAAELGPYERATVREAARDYKKVTAVTKEMAQREAELESEGYQAWVKARQESNFAAFAPVLQEWLALRRQKAALVDASRPVYDVLLDDFEKGMTAARLDEIFGQVKEGLVPLLADLRARGKAPSDAWLKGDYDTDKQAELCNKVAVVLGFDLEKGRLDVSVHPFTGGSHPTDVRMTTRFKKDDLTEGITGAIHETGHSLYEQGRNQQYDGLPVNEALGMGVHESQSLLWERMVALSQPFSAFLLPLLREHFPSLPADKNPEDLYAALNIVKHPSDSSMIRVEADEVTYPLHIIIRYELEKALLEGKIAVDDLPKLWNQKMKEYLGCEPESDARGVLQDVHWSAGALGYFPTYSLGAMYACQLFKAAQVDLPTLDADIAAGNFAPLKAWLNEKVHKVGSLHPSGDELMKAVTGAPLDPQIFLDYLQQKYTKLYQL
ncbi:Carboxypeptidase Taq [Micractinium conductrix]|uniref:Carboxypeptidase Taq n=1 Tax=Micractinium conductrix TaxID=554055 RepID=A0A2P6VA45_9CHLO|nr:Carboxypeptidase Taq [Micractinium conductrix]|eukprot:PSC70957.1 Carboxypeptidase Taq [Micractinium conductrix]